MPPTMKQITVIGIICHNLHIKFTGSTKKEASKFISEHIEKSKQISYNNYMSCINYNDCELFDEYFYFQEVK